MSFCFIFTTFSSFSQYSNHSCKAQVSTNGSVDEFNMILNFRNEKVFCTERRFQINEQRQI